MRLSRIPREPASQRFAFSQSEDHLGASCTTSPRKSTGKWQTGLTGFTRSSLDRAAHYHNRLQRRRHGAPVAAAGPARTLARRAPAATADRAAGRDPRDCAPAAGLAPSPERPTRSWSAAAAASRLTPRSEVVRDDSGSVHE